MSLQVFAKYSSTKLIKFQDKNNCKSTLQSNLLEKSTL